MTVAITVQRAAVTIITVTGDRHRKRTAAMSAAVTGSGRYRYRRPLPEATVTGGRYRKRAAAMEAAVT
jgi:hypothetical protein